jgi:hypothetical protein
MVEGLSMRLVRDEVVSSLLLTSDASTAVGVVKEVVAEMEKRLVQWRLSAEGQSHGEGEYFASAKETATDDYGPPDESVVAQIVRKGFPKNGAKRAVYFTRSESVEKALAWAVTHCNDADFDFPFALKVKGALKTNDVGSSLSIRVGECMLSGPALAVTLQFLKEEVLALMETPLAALERGDEDYTATAQANDDNEPPLRANPNPYPTTLAKERPRKTTMKSKPKAAIRLTTDDENDFFGDLDSLGESLRQVVRSSTEVPSLGSAGPAAAEGPSDADEGAPVTMLPALTGETAVVDLPEEGTDLSPMIGEDVIRMEDVYAMTEGADIVPECISPLRSPSTADLSQVTAAVPQSSAPSADSALDRVAEALSSLLTAELHERLLANELFPCLAMTYPLRTIFGVEVQERDSYLLDLQSRCITDNPAHSKYKEIPCKELSTDILCASREASNRLTGSGPIPPMFCVLLELLALAAASDRVRVRVRVRGGPSSSMSAIRSFLGVIASATSGFLEPFLDYANDQFDCLFLTAALSASSHEVPSESLFIWNLSGFVLREEFIQSESHAPRSEADSCCRECVEECAPMLEELPVR